MARILHVKAAQQRYKTVPVLDENGQQKQSPVVLSSGRQKLTKTGQPVFRKLTIEDPAQPLPPEVCDFCHESIAVGTPYKYTAGIIKRSRHEACPTWPPFGRSTDEDTTHE
jgi:hypothetical protein